MFSHNACTCCHVRFYNFSFQWISSFWSRPFSWFIWVGCWICNWYSWWCRCKRYSAAAKVVCWNDSYSYFCWSTWIIRTYCSSYTYNQVNKLGIKVYMGRFFSQQWLFILTAHELKAESLCLIFVTPSLPPPFPFRIICNPDIKNCKVAISRISKVLKFLLVF